MRTICNSRLKTSIVVFIHTTSLKFMSINFISRTFNWSSFFDVWDFCQLWFCFFFSSPTLNSSRFSFRKFFVLQITSGLPHGSPIFIYSSFCKISKVTHASHTSSMYVDEIRDVLKDTNFFKIYKSWYGWPKFRKILSKSCFAPISYFFFATSDLSSSFFSEWHPMNFLNKIRIRSFPIEDMIIRVYCGSLRHGITNFCKSLYFLFWKKNEFFTRSPVLKIFVCRSVIFRVRNISNKNSFDDLCKELMKFTLNF